MEYLVVGEAPGKIEDIKGEPFIGPAGMFLRAALRHAGLDTEQAAFLNVVACYPHGSPDVDAIEACKPHFRAQWEAIPAKYVLVCGSVALRAIIGSAELRYAIGQAVDIHDKVVFPVFHPSYILRSKDALVGWRQDLSRFAAMVHMDYPLEQTRCLYCNASVIRTVACHKHMRVFNRDKVWKPPKPRQDSLWSGT